MADIDVSTQVIQGMVKRMRIALNEIQPAVSVAGLLVESETIRMMKSDLDSLEQGLTALPAQCAARHDLISQAEELVEMLTGSVDPADMTDAELHISLMAAEAYVKRCYEYLISKESCLEKGEQHAA